MIYRSNYIRSSSACSNSNYYVFFVYNLFLQVLHPCFMAVFIAVGRIGNTLDTTCQYCLHHFFRNTIGRGAFTCVQHSYSATGARTNVKHASAILQAERCLVNCQSYVLEFFFNRKGNALVFVIYHTDHFNGFTFINIIGPFIYALSYSHLPISFPIEHQASHMTHKSLLNPCRCPHPTSLLPGQEYGLE